MLFEITINYDFTQFYIMQIVIMIIAVIVMGLFVFRRKKEWSLWFYAYCSQTINVYALGFITQQNITPIFSKSSVIKTDKSVKEILEIIQDQQNKIHKIVTEISNIAAVAQENSASIEETAAGTEEQSASMEQIAENAQILLNLATELVKNED